MTARGTADKVRIARWLKQQGLAQYAQAFKQHNIGFDVLPQLRDEDLKELGVPLGDRKRLLKAIADLRMAPESADDAMKSAAARGPPIRRVDPERRQLTLLFCDLVASTELSARLDPEDLREVVYAYQACVAAAVERFQGTCGRVPRRWRPGLLRLPTSARGRCRAGGAQRASDCRGRRCARAAYRRAAPGPRRHCYRHGGGGRSDRKAPPAKWPWSAMCRILPRGCRCWRRRTR